MATVLKTHRIREPFLRPLRELHAWWVLAVAALLALVGAGAHQLVFVQWAHGLEVTGLNASIAWGLYIVNFVFLVGASAGGIIIAALAHIVEFREFKAISRIAELQSIASLILATLFIFASLGAPDRFWHLFVYPHLGSPLIWDVLIISIYLGLTLAMGYLGGRADVVRLMAVFPRRRWLYWLLALGYTDLSPAALARERQLLKTLSWAAIPTAVLLHSITAWILGLVKARATWHTSLMGPLFVVSAVASGIALVALGAVILRTFFRVEIAEPTVRALGRTLAVSIPVLGYFLFAELLTVAFGGETATAGVILDLIWGHFAPFFWVNLIVGLLLPLFLLVIPTRISVGWAFARAAAATAFAGLVLAVWPWAGANVQTLAAEWLPAWGERVQPLWIPALLVVVILVMTVVLPSASVFLRVGTAAAFVLAGVLLERTNIVILPQLHRYLNEFYGQGRYVPTWPEIAVTVGIYALGVLSFFVLAKVFPMVELTDEAT